MKIRSTTAVNDSLNRRKKPGNRQSITVPAVFSTVSAAGPAEGSCTLASLAKKAAMKAALRGRKITLTRKERIQELYTV